MRAFGLFSTLINLFKITYQSAYLKKCYSLGGHLDRYWRLWTNSGLAVDCRRHQVRKNFLPWDDETKDRSPSRVKHVDALAPSLLRPVRLLRPARRFCLILRHRSVNARQPRRGRAAPSAADRDSSQRQHQKHARQHVNRATSRHTCGCAGSCAGACASACHAGCQKRADHRQRAGHRQVHISVEVLKALLEMNVWVHLKLPYGTSQMNTMDAQGT